MLERIKDNKKIIVSIFVAAVIGILVSICLKPKTNEGEKKIEKNFEELFCKYIFNMEYETVDWEKFEEIYVNKELEENSYFGNLDNEILYVEDYDKSIGISFMGEQYFLFAYGAGGKTVKDNYVGELIGNGKIGETDYSVYEINNLEDYISIDYIAIKFSNCDYKFVFYRIKDIEVNNFEELLTIFGNSKNLEIARVFAEIYEGNMHVGYRCFYINPENKEDIWQMLYAQADKEMIKADKRAAEIKFKYYENITIHIGNKKTGVTAVSLKFNDDGKMLINGEYLLDTGIEFYEKILKYINEECKAYIYEW